MIISSPLSLAIYSADAWVHACLALRLKSPALHAGYALIQGAEWANGVLSVFPERVPQADVVVITRDFPAYLVEYEQVISQARAHGKPVVYETDDLLMELPEYHPDYERYLVARAAMLRAVVEADAVVGSTPDLCEYLQAFNPNAWLWQNYLDEQLWQLKAPTHNITPPGRPVTIGYMGGQSHSPDLEIVMPVLMQILEDYPSKVGLKFWTLEPPPSLRNHPAVEYIPVRLVDYSSFAAYFPTQTCDIFIAPLQDNLFNRCKSWLKFLEYSALATPGIYSRIAPYEKVVIHGQNGFLASGPEEWMSCLRMLIEDADLRFRIGTKAQETLRNQWLLGDHLDIFMQLYQGFATRSLAATRPASVPGVQIVQKMSVFYQDLLRKRERESPLMERLDVLQAQMAEQQRTIFNLSRVAQEYYALYLEIMTSRSWRLMQRLVELRLRLAPRGSRRERVLAAAYQSVAALKNQGLRASVRTALQGLFSPTSPADQALSGIHPRLFDGPVPEAAICDLPAITILMIKDIDRTPTPATEILRWLRTQTLPQAAQIVVWDKAAGKAALLDHAYTSWRANDISTLLRGLQTPYICMASADLLEQEATYLETNLCALQAESLAFTVNLRGLKAWQKQLLQAGRLPGDRSLPLLRQIVRKECIVEDVNTGSLALDLNPWLKSRQTTMADGSVSYDPGAIAGRIIILTTSFEDSEKDLPFETSLSSPTMLIGRHLVLAPQSVSPQIVLENPPLAHTLLPLDQVMPIVPEPGNLPTVLMVLPLLAVGGAEKIALKIIQYLTGQVRFVVLTFDELEPQLGTMADDFRRATPYVYTLPDFAHSQLNASALDYLIARFTPSTVYIHNGTSWIYDNLGEIKSRYPHIRLVNQVYDHQVGWINRYDPSLLLYLDAHIGSNPRICQAYIQKGARPEQVYLIENGSDPHELDPSQYDQGRLSNLKLKLGLPNRAKVVTFASRLHYQKRPMDFVELARRFSFDPQVVFLMAGDGPLAPHIDEQIRKIGLNNIYRIPFYQPISDLLALTDVLVLPSEFEGMPMIVLEAQTMGKPVVVTDVGNNRELLERTQGGVLLERIGDVSAIMSAVRQMLNNPPDPVALRRRTLDIFDWKILAEKYRLALLADFDG